MTALLEVHDLQTFYGRSQALFGLNLNVGPAEMVTLLGRNGMGKTTTVRSIIGLLRPQGGSIRFRGEAIEDKPAHRIAQSGIGVVPEGRQIFPNLTVREHLLAWAANRSGAAEPWTLDRVFGLFPRLHERRLNLGSQLSGGEQQMLAIGRVLMTNPYLLILDEATEGLAPLVRREIWNCLRLLKQNGLSILVIDKYVQALIELADRHVIIERGKVQWEGTSAELAGQRDLWQRYLGV
jgi:branched-chain amino acid transport system ATP-binding protein